MHLEDFSGRRFGRLVAISRAEPPKPTRWLCRCDCGREVSVLAPQLKRGTQSCGCLRKEVTSARRTTHGASRTRLHTIWANMKARCLNPRQTNYAYYGGRGITVVEPWHAFEPFRDWALVNGYADDLTLDRKDSDGHYCPSNCQWATRGEQSANRRNTERRADGRPWCLVAKDNGIPAHAYDSRRQKGWPSERAATAPFHRRST